MNEKSIHQVLTLEIRENLLLESIQVKGLTDVSFQIFPVILSQ